MKKEQNQEFKSSGMLALMGLVGFSAILIATPWNRQLEDSEIEAARQKAEVVGYQVVQIYREASKSAAAAPSQNGSRNPASVSGDAMIENLRTTGTMGMDPWGQPYHYRILSSEKSKNIKILVWSAGPNMKAETPDLDDESKKLPIQPTYQGDDIGVVLSMSQN